MKYYSVLRPESYKMTINCGLLKEIKYFKGSMSDFYITKLVYKNKKFNITYHCKENRLIIHEWYELEKDEIDNITNELTNYFIYLQSVA